MTSSSSFTGRTPNKPDISEIENVCKYVVAYASKKNHTSKKEKEAVQNIIER